MSEQRFEYGETDLFEWVEVDGEMISTKECVNKLNQQQSTIQSLKEENRKLKKRLRKCANNWKQEIVERGKLEEETMIMRDYYESQTATRED